MRNSGRLLEIARSVGCRMENSRLRSMSARQFLAWVLVEALVLQPILVGASMAAPQDATVVAGDVSIATTDATTVIHASDGSIIDYSSFDIQVAETVQFIQPGSASRVLNRIRSALPTQIDGSLLANGHVYIVNPSGVFFGEGAHIDVGALVAAAGHITNDDFLSGLDHFRLTGAVENLGEIQAQEAALIGNFVLNSGVIRGETVVVLAAGDDVFLMQPGERGFVKVDRSVIEAGATGIVNTGTIDAGSGSVVMAAGDLYSLAIFNSGAVRGGDILVAGGALDDADRLIEISRVEVAIEAICIDGDDAGSEQRSKSGCSEEGCFHGCLGEEGVSSCLCLRPRRMAEPVQSIT